MKATGHTGTLCRMRRIALIAALTTLAATPALAQSFTGNWACRDATSAKAGILTIYGEVYGFASSAMGDPSSGTGSRPVSVNDLLLTNTFGGTPKFS